VDTSGPEPRWVPAEAFDIRQHVRRRTDPQCVSKADLWRIVGGLMSEHLDRSKPLWTFDVIGPLSDGRVAIAARIHHAMADGIAGVHFLDAVLFDARDDVAHDHATKVSPGMRSPSGSPGWPKRAGCPARCCASWAIPAGIRPRPADQHRPRACFRRCPVGAVQSHRCRATRARDGQRCSARHHRGGLRRGVGTSAAHQLRAQIPVSLHHRDESTAEAGNRDSFLNVDLPSTSPTR